MEAFRKVAWACFQRSETEEQMWVLPSKLYPQDSGDNKLMVGI